MNNSSHRSNLRERQRRRRLNTVAAVTSVCSTFCVFYWHEHGLCVIKSILYLHRKHFFSLFFLLLFIGSCTCEIGLYEGCIVSCKIVDEVPVLDVVNVTACNEKDWEMLVSMPNSNF